MRTIIYLLILFNLPNAGFAINGNVGLRSFVTTGEPSFFIKEKSNAPVALENHGINENSAKVILQKTASNQFTVTSGEYEFQSGSFTLRNSIGVELMRLSHLKGSKWTFDRGVLPYGVYVYTMVDEDGTMLKGKLVAIQLEQ